MPRRPIQGTGGRFGFPYCGAMSRPRWLAVLTLALAALIGVQVYRIVAHDNFVVTYSESR